MGRMHELNELLNEGAISVKNKDKIEAMKIIKDMKGHKVAPSVKELEAYAKRLEAIIKKMPDTYQEMA